MMKTNKQAINLNKDKNNESDGLFGFVMEMIIKAIPIMIFVSTIIYALLSWEELIQLWHDLHMS